MDFSKLMSLLELGQGAGGAGKVPVPSGVPGAIPSGNEREGSFGRRIGGALSGFGQALMSPDMRRTYGTARSGGYEDLMENQRIGDFVRGDDTQDFVRRFQELRGKMVAPGRGVQPAVPTRQLQ